MRKAGALFGVCLSLWSISGYTDQAITLVAGGDVILGRNIGYAIDAYGAGYPFSKVKHIIKNADIAFANLESPISDCNTPYARAHTFPANPRRAMSLLQAGFDVISLANNHSLDCGSNGLTDTVDHLNRLSIDSIGVKRSDKESVSYHIRGKKMGFLAYSLASDPAYRDAKGNRYKRFDRSILALIKSTKQNVDIVVVSLHWGIENTDQPYAKQVKLAHQLIDAGVDIILGHGSHTIQKIEKYKNGLILYSLGNLLFDQYGRVGSLVTIYINNRSIDFDNVTVQMERGRTGPHQ